MDKSIEQKSQLLKQWKKAFIEAVIKTLNPIGKILEIGFGSGLAAECISTYPIKNHIIIESNPEIFPDAVKWAANKSHVSIIRESGQTELHKLGVFDVIIFNDSPKKSDDEIMTYLFASEANVVIDHAKELLIAMEVQISKIKVHYTDEQIDDFYQKIGQLNLTELPKFFRKLKDNGNITKEQCDRIFKKYELMDQQKSFKQSVVESKPDLLLLCLEECLKSHMHKGSRFAYLLNNHISKYEDSLFFDRIITNSHLDYKEQSFSIEFNGESKDALAMIITKEG